MGFGRVAGQHPQGGPGAAKSAHQRADRLVEDGQRLSAVDLLIVQEERWRTRDAEFVRLRGRVLGDLASLRDAGAYGASMSSNYNARPLAPEILLDGGELKQIRRRQTGRRW